MFILHLALGGCLGRPPIRFGLTADTGGHIAYVLEAARAQAELSRVRRMSVVTRLFEDARLGAQYARPQERMDPKTTIDRVATGNRAYLEKEALAADLADFAEAFCLHLAGLSELPDVIHAHFADAAFAAKAAQARYGIPFVYTPHALGIDKCRHLAADEALNLRIASERAAIAAADAIIVSTRDEAERQLAAYAVARPGRVLCLAPGVPRRRLQTAAASITQALPQWLDDPGKPIVLAIARPVRKKNLTGLMRAFATTPRLQQRANLVILAGQHASGLISGEEQEVLSELKRLSLSLRGKVALPAGHDAADVMALYHRASARGVFVNPALHEPFGLTLIEAADCGVPVVATRHGGPVDIIETIGHGLLVDPRDEAAIGESCLRILSSPALHRRFSQAARANIHKYSWSRYAERSTSLYGSLRSNTRSTHAAA